MAQAKLTYSDCGEFRAIWTWHGGWGGLRRRASKFKGYRQPRGSMAGCFWTCHKTIDDVLTDKNCWLSDHRPQIVSKTVPAGLNPLTSLLPYIGPWHPNRPRKLPVAGTAYLVISCGNRQACRSAPMRKLYSKVDSQGSLHRYSSMCYWRRWAKEDTNDIIRLRVGCRVRNIYRQWVQHVLCSLRNTLWLQKFLDAATL